MSRSRRASRSALLLSCLALACLPAPATASVLFRATDLGVTMRRDSHRFFHMNDHGQVVGDTFSEHPTYQRAFLYDSRTGAVEDWGRDLFDGKESVALAINERGQALVSVRDSIGESYAVVDQGRVTWTSRPEPGLRYMTIGNDGQPRGYVMGQTASGSGSVPVALVEGDRRLPAPAFPEDTRRSMVLQMSENGLLVGSYGLGGPPGPTTSGGGFLIKDGEFIDLGRSEPWAVNSLGDVGIHENRHEVMVPNENRLTLYDRHGERTIIDDNGMLRLPQSINNSGQIVGVMVDSPYDTHSPGFFFDGEALHDLNTLLDPETPDWYITRASWINESGQILATALGPDDLYHALLLTPNDQPAPIPPTSLPAVSEPVPEPSALLVLASGLGLVLARRRARARARARR